MSEDKSKAYVADNGDAPLFLWGERDGLAAVYRWKAKRPKRLGGRLAKCEALEEKTKAP